MSSDTEALVMEIALTALKDKGMSDKIGDKLDLSDQELEKIKIFPLTQQKKIYQADCGLNAHLVQRYSTSQNLKKTILFAGNAVIILE